MSASPQPIEPARPVMRAETMSGAADLELEVLRLRDRVLGLRAENAELSAQLAGSIETAALRSGADAETVTEHLETVVHDLDFQLRQVKASTTWRLGSALLRPVRWVRREKSS